MDTILGVSFDDFVILAADKIESFGILKIAEDSKKVYPLTSHVAMAIMGESGDVEHFTRFVQCNFELEKFRDDGWEVSLTRAWNWISWQLAQDIRSSSPNQVFPIVGGYCYQEKKCQLYWMDYLGTCSPVTYGANGYGESMAVGFLDRHHRPNMNKEQGIELVKGALDAITTRSMISQKIFQMVLVDKDGIQELPDHLKMTMVKN